MTKKTKRHKGRKIERQSERDRKTKNKAQKTSKGLVMNFDDIG